MAVTVRPIEDKDRPALTRLLEERWAGPEILIDGEMIDASALPGFVAEDGGQLVGLVTVIKRPDEWEIVTLDSLNRWAGTGSQLLQAVVEEARKAGLARVMTRTSNDNLDAFRFYQRRGFRLERVVHGVIDEERKLKPEIPVSGQHGIPMHDEIVFARTL
ncbi:GNAT family N-acetyltransferase [Polymorphum gilvum]|uniref:Acetyltransferase, GNAT family protein n=1 Tax=Polymorphum gilvum (strain LMG 25793 / CGMCC 1.9160 / SL003B-26A1) TaxID=991905 RepID=F2IZQ0_POLGS|nr:GNAT family N-acetyltransferase [Polymorphum gilvum]ADZ69607.1 Acetyltransferase, GNAT family protein [Polymorphum gilvum SL003B-26A1]